MMSARAGAVMLKADNHTNLFWSYQNAALEDNCTRALMVTLKACGNSVIARFIRTFAGISASGPFSVALQAAPNTASAKPAPGATVLAITTRRQLHLAQRLGPIHGKLRIAW